MEMTPPDKKETEKIHNPVDPTTAALSAISRIAKNMNEIKEDIGEIRGDLNGVHRQIEGINENVQNLNFKLGSLSESDRAKSLKLKEINGELEPIRMLRKLWKTRRIIFVALGAIIAIIAGVIAALVDKGIF